MASAGFFELFLIAATAQLAVLPGEKVQFIISGLSTRFSPWVVVAAAGTAFAGWTVVEIVVGKALSNALPPAVLTGFTAALFFVFAAMMLRSAPAPGTTGTAETDGGFNMGESELRAFDPEIAGFELPDVVTTYVAIFAMMAAGEFGDKTQLITINLAATYGAAPAIWFGEMAAIIPVSLANAFFFYRFSRWFDLRKAHFAGATIFTFFGLDAALTLTIGVSLWERLVGAVSGLLLAFV
ncbi:MAG: TMEM165/GDT1 family protein [Salinirussus sp.]